LDTSPPALLTLLELRRHYPEIFGQVEVYVDGGIRRGTDVLKALCLGATAVSIGRTFLYALNYGEGGVEHLIDSKSFLVHECEVPYAMTRATPRGATLIIFLVLRDELETAMRLVGITDLSQVHPGLVNTGDIDHLIPSTLTDVYTGKGPKAKI
jgi:L-lactate dehydrogenase (cytochrome)